MAVTKITHAGVDERRAAHADPEPVQGFLDGGARSLEVRWIRRGPLPPALIDRFGPFGDPIEVRSDRYLVDPSTAEFGVKIRGGVQLDVKAYRGSQGRLRVPGGEGALEVWEKWSLPLRATDPEKDAGGWITLDKTRRRRAFELNAHGLVECSVLEEVEAGCTFELTGFVGGGELWWTLGLEASGAEGTLELSLRACADLLLDRPLPDRITLPLDASMSYTRWLPMLRREIGPASPELPVSPSAGGTPEQTREPTRRAGRSARSLVSEDLDREVAR